MKVSKIRCEIEATRYSRDLLALSTNTAPTYLFINFTDAANTSHRYLGIVIQVVLFETLAPTNLSISVPRTHEAVE